MRLAAGVVPVMKGSPVPFGVMSERIVLPARPQRRKRAITGAEHQELFQAERRRQEDKWELEQVCTTQRKRFAAKLAAGEARILKARYGDADGGDMQLAQIRK
jgi:hypothetical protein